MKQSERKRIRFGVIGLGLMGREFASAVARWCHLLGDGPVPVITAICSGRQASQTWFTDNFESIRLAVTDPAELLASSAVDAVYCAVPHHLHAALYRDILRAGKHLLGEKPFGIDQAANDAILAEVRNRPDLIVRCSSEFPYYPGAQHLIRWLNERRYGRLMEVRAGFHHASDMDLDKPINWKRQVEFNGAYGVMGDLGMHVQHIPFRCGWFPKTVYAGLLNIAPQRPDSTGRQVPCETWDNATLLCRCLDPEHGTEFQMMLETKRMAPGQTNTWFVEVYGTEGSAMYSTHDPKAFWTLQTRGREQGWTRLDVGAASALPGITGAIFETGFSDAFQQMLGAYMREFGGESPDCFQTVLPEETALSHRLLTAALESHEIQGVVAV